MLRAVGVIVGQADDLQARHVAFGLQALEFRDEALGPPLVAVAQVEAADTRDQCGLAGPSPAHGRDRPASAVGDELAVAAVADRRLAARSHK